MPPASYHRVTQTPTTAATTAAIERERGGGACTHSTHVIKHIKHWHHIDEPTLADVPQTAKHSPVPHHCDADVTGLKVKAQGQHDSTRHAKPRAWEV